MFELTLVTPESKVVANAELEDLRLPAYMGELQILPGHSPLMTTLDTGVLQYTLKSGEQGKIFISWGYCQVHPHGVFVLAEQIYHKDQIDVSEKTFELKKLEEQLGSVEMTDEEWSKTQKQVKMLRAQLEFAKN
jgi:F-type H+-transporting ATPase subunit epsilon